MAKFPTYLTLLPLFFATLSMQGCLDNGRGDYPTIQDYDDIVRPDPEPPVPPTPESPLRPDGAVIISNYCVCQDGKPLNVNNCELECSERDKSTSPMLYVKTTLKPEIKEDPLLGNLYNWCNAAYGESTSPACFLRVVSEGHSSKDLQITNLNAVDNSFEVNLTSQLAYNRRYQIQLVEITSGAKSDAKVLLINEPETDPIDTRLISIENISTYNCISRAASIVNNKTEIEAAVKMTYFFAPSNAPSPIAKNDKLTLCHDPYAPGQGPQDSASYPRLFERKGIFSLWNSRDQLFTKSSEDPNAYDINVRIRKLADKQGIDVGTAQFFGPLNWPTRPAVRTQESNNSSSSNKSDDMMDSKSNMSSGDGVTQIGFYMQPWVDERSEPFCPKEADFADNSRPIFGILGKFIGDTEGIYMAEREDATVVINGVEQSAPLDILLISETELKKLWFYIDTATHEYLRPKDISEVNQNLMMFYWPPNYEAPTTKNPNSMLYTVRFPDDIGDSVDNVLSIKDKRPLDKRFGCIPKKDK